MKTQRILKVLLAAGLLSSCANTGYKKNLDIKPVQNVQHGYEQAQAQYELGRYFHGQRRHVAAIAAYRQALALNPALIDALNGIGIAYAETGDIALSRRQFEIALTLEPTSIYTLNNLGFAHYLAGDYPAAIDAYKQALQLDASHELTRKNLVLAYQGMGRGQQIARTAAKPEEVLPSPPAVNDPSPQAAWEKLSPVVYVMHRADLPVADNKTPAVRGVEMTLAASQPAATLAARETRNVPASPNPVGASAAHSPASIVSQDIQAPRSPAQIFPVTASVSDKAEADIRESGLKGVEVSNGNGIRGLAARVAAYFSRKGVSQARLTNSKTFSENHTRIEYRPGHEADAARLNGLLPKAVKLTPAPNLRHDIHMRLVLGRDMTPATTTWVETPETGQTVVAGLALLRR